MNGYTQGAITGGIGEGLQQASANILNLYGMQRHFDMQQQNLDIQNKTAATYNKRVDLKNFGSDKWWEEHQASSARIQEEWKKRNGF